MSVPSDIMLVTGDTKPSAPTAGKVLLYAKSDGVFYSMDPNGFEYPIGGGFANGTVHSVDIDGGTTGLLVAGGPITTTGVFTLGGTLSIEHGGTGFTTAEESFNALAPNQIGNGGKFLQTDGDKIFWADVPKELPAIEGNAGKMLVTDGESVMWQAPDNTLPVISITGDVTGSGTDTIEVSLPEINTSTGTFGGSSAIPVITTDAKGRITAITTSDIVLPISAIGYEMVVFKYTAGGSGTLAAEDAIQFETSGVKATVIDGDNSIVSYEFTGINRLPSSIMVYGQNYNANTFRITSPTTHTITTIIGGGTSDLPDIINGIFSASNAITVQSRPSDTGASGAIGKRAYLIVVFGF